MQLLLQIEINFIYQFIPISLLFALHWWWRYIYGDSVVSVFAFVF